MTFILSIPGLLKTVLILIGVFVALRFLGQMMIAKRNLAEQNALRERKVQLSKEKAFVEKNTGKISISKKADRSAEDIEFEEV